MHQARRKGPRRAVAYAVFAAALALASVTLSQCTMLGDNVTGVGLERNGSTSCTKQCNDAAFAARALCEKNHETAREACRTLPEGPDRDACEAEAGAEHTACNAAANEQKVECQNSCHRQGTGSAG